MDATWGWSELLTTQARERNPYLIIDEEIDQLDRQVYPFWLHDNVRQYTYDHGDDPALLDLDARFALYFMWKISTVYFDLKLADDAEHRRHTGRGNRRIHDNLRRLASRPDLDLLPRIPLVPGITDSSANLSALATLLLDLGLRRVALLPYKPPVGSQAEGAGPRLALRRAGEDVCSAGGPVRGRARTSGAGGDGALNPGARGLRSRPRR